MHVYKQSLWQSNKDISFKCCRSSNCISQVKNSIKNPLRNLRKKYRQMCAFVWYTITKLTDCTGFNGLTLFPLLKGVKCLRTHHGRQCEPLSGQSVPHCTIFDTQPQKFLKGDTPDAPQHEGHNAAIPYL